MSIVLAIAGGTDTIAAIEGGWPEMSVRKLKVEKFEGLRYHTVLVTWVAMYCLWNGDVMNVLISNQTRYNGRIEIVGIPPNYQETLDKFGRTGKEWMEHHAHRILDHGGWRHNDGVYFDLTPISENEYVRRYHQCTVMPGGTTFL